MSDTDRPTRRRGWAATPTTQEGHRATTLELFFDLVYVFALRRAMVAVGSYLHLGIVAGILLVALGTERAMENIETGSSLDIFSANLLAVGLGLYLLSTGLYWRRTVGGLLRIRLAVAVFLPVLVPLLVVVPALLGMLATGLVCAGVALAERSGSPAAS